MSTARLRKGIQERKSKQPVEIDFTQHQLEDGAIVNTQERVVKDVGCSELVISLHFSLTDPHPPQRSWACTGPSSRDANPYRRTVLLSDRSLKARHCIPQKPLLSRGPTNRGAMPLHHRRGHRNSQEGTQSSRCRCSSNRSVPPPHTVQSCSSIPDSSLWRCSWPIRTWCTRPGMRHTHNIFFFSTIS
jgi:hypothetical protein